MAGQFLDIFFTPAARAAQAHYYGQTQTTPPAAGTGSLGPAETEFIARRDSFYLATVTGDGWPYIQHRGGPAGFLKKLEAQTLGFADFKGNRQLLSTGNLAANGRVALFLMDYPQRERLKIIGHARVLDAREHPELADQLTPAPGLRGKVERLFLISVIGFDWNCPQYITPRYTEAEVRQAVAALQRRIAELEAQIKAGR